MSRRTRSIVSVCGLSDGLIPSCTGQLIAEAKGGVPVTSPSQLFSTADEMILRGDISAFAGGHDQAMAGHLRFR